MVEKISDLLKKIHIKRPALATLILWGIGLALAIALFVFLRGFVGCWRLTSLPGMPLPGCSNAGASPTATPEFAPATQTTEAATPGETPVAVTVSPTLAAPQANLPEPWDGASRINILFIGLDYRDWAAGLGAPRSDTMIVFTIDPLTKTAGMLSIPRDMWVEIPGGFDYGKINMAYMFGEQEKIPPYFGPSLAMRTVEDFLGIQIQYFAQVDFQTFERVIDEIGCINVDVPTKLKVDPIGGDTVNLKPGVHQMCGPLALAYARARNTKYSDVDRAYRQQQVIVAIRDKVLDPQNFLNLITKAPALYQELSAGIHTNLPFEDAMSLVMLFKDIPLEKIKRGVIDYDMAPPAKVTYNGDEWDIVRPIPDKIRVLRDEIFGSGALGPMAVGDPAQLMKDEGARVSVLNGTYTAGLAGRTGDYFTAQGMNVASVGDFSYTARTIIIDHTGKPYLVRYLMTLMNLTSSQLSIQFDPNALVDVEIILGDDWAFNNPMP